MKKLTLTGLSGSAISAKTWFDYYKELLNRKPQGVDKEFDKHVTEFIETHDASCILCQNNVSEGDTELEKLNSEITEEEVKINIKKAKSGKTHGVDGILNEANNQQILFLSESLTSYNCEMIIVSFLNCFTLGNKETGVHCWTSHLVIES